MNPPANWYEDPTGRHGQRYWDGSAWTEHVFTDGVQSVDLLDGSGTADERVDEVVSEETAGSAADTGESVSEDVVDDPDPEDQVSDDDVVEEAPVEEAPGDDAADASIDAVPSAGEDDTDLFTDANGAGDAAGSESGEEVAPAVETEDVVGSLDEVGQGRGEGASPEGADEPQPDMSDAFVLAPEFVTRLVGGRSEAAEGTPAASVAAQHGAPPAARPPTGPVDAPPAASQQAPPAATGDDAAGTITGELVDGAYAEREEAGPVSLQNARMLRCAVRATQGVVARQGTMVAYQGDVSFERQGAGGIGKALKRAATGEGLAMMRVEGAGDVFFADGAQHVFVLHLDAGAQLSVNGRNVLAFDAALGWDVERVKGANLLAGGLFNTTLTGTGWVALVSDGQPVVLRTDEAPTHVDVNALVAWSGGLSTRVVSTTSAKSLVGLGSGEAFQMAFDGAGIVIVQPSEGSLGGAATP